MTPTASSSWQPHLGPERVVEGIHYGWLMKDHLARYYFAQAYCRGKRVLDIATGSGYGANILRNGGAREVVAVDCNHDALAYARNRYGTRGIIWMEADAHDLPLQGPLDTVVSFETIEHLERPDRFLEELGRLLSPEGVALISTPQFVGGDYVSEHHEKEYTLPEFRSMLERRFGEVEIYGQRRMMRFPIPFLTGVLNRYHIEAGRGSLRVFRLLNVLAKAPNVFTAWFAGRGEAFRRQIRPIDAPKPSSRWVDDDYFIMVAVCRKPI